MKALILAAGFGTRLLPYTKTRPKPLFTLAGTTILGITIKRLIQIGCTEIFVNTHHLNGQIEAYIDQAGFSIPVQTIHESRILDTGGAIKNVKTFMGSSDFMVINADIATDIDLESVWQFHLAGNWPVTLVVHDRAEFNRVQVDPQGFVCAFSNQNGLTPNVPENRCLAFTGIQVLSPKIFDYMPEKSVFSSIDLYQSLADQGPLVKAHVVDNHFWEDIGTLAAYERVALCHLALKAFEAPGRRIVLRDIEIRPICGDGSDRKWFRAFWNGKSVVICSHGISTNDNICEIDSFMALGDHLKSRNLPVPGIVARDRFSGLVALEDLGDCHFESMVASKTNGTQRVHSYFQVVDRLIGFSTRGIQGFEPEMAFQTPCYSKDLILEKECGYFAEAFLKGFLNQNPPMELLVPEFNYLADKALDGGVMGLMHRDFQSRNLMVKNHELFFIDFQSARQGPLQYDLASLLIDPYVGLDDGERDEIMDYCITALSSTMAINRASFVSSYRHCCITRNFQILGAFSYLGMVKKKKRFLQYIPLAVSTLKKGITRIDTENVPALNTLVEKLQCGQ
ncbi:two-component fusion protein (glucose-1-phosphate adenylyltransferase/aminoglycoside phosphotransferase) [Desulforapulum autotrophicum HRM2]|uniref:Two-component fusion protein (Glucose-1-phosphate adenylyltransferase/aminoglycoside phosphotransferase) n=1 Tax=Desulforapulum autotrophicum (strain ATCC 43914 / DSM 3382 / VKM B-1955 / HRM2) TaxID=177437 RepID=C0QFZ6_DESAH|nr:sugar phosphate nucleotidyltransferase [Desulforapulum autotrophicum]ACN15564.1 two-component fusion protein (glucose-1-phosphate adenylyltransferase/aminoglycoside phosphotransferase) [Desulforapulum autotrophicum HRM2]